MNLEEKNQQELLIVSDHFSVNPENTPSIFHFAHAELPAKVVPFDEIDGRHPGALGHAEVVELYLFNSVHHESEFVEESLGLLR